MEFLNKTQKSFLKKIIPLVAFMGGLCCFTPVILVLFGLSSVAFAASLSDTLYGQYRWIFRGVALLLLLGAVGLYLYTKENICTLDKLKREKRKVINLILLTLVLGVVAYMGWLYVVVEMIGSLLRIW